MISFFVSDPQFSVEVEEDGGVLKKRKFRSRAHANPLADPHFEYPVDREIHEPVIACTRTDMRQRGNVPPLHCFPDRM